ncbi:SRPBCC family protein [Bacillus bingmayongensis]|uniref:hypothetical protein n=1 Tax=Bacillus bingmayongensis TaxID=1150157 RepID=UPI00030D9261|nr:hypothetical protein [Bacillus bingmayongensis]MBY0595935.1 hypothetical protein [Bacillus bingmayongensis]
MWNYEHTIFTDADPGSIWNLYQNVSEWSKWDNEILKSYLEGSFESGSIGTLTIFNRKPSTFTLTEVKENESFTNVMEIDELNIQIVFYHYINNVDSQTKVTHGVRILGHNANELGERIGPMLTKNIPQSIGRLVKLAGENE